MRLTLRTLLAYLDDILEPGQTKEIGAKLNESSLASSLVSRIREVMRRRRLTAPTLSGPGVGIDPNAVAEYLDNTLPPDGVADVEKICLESDVHLAEVAACHQILTLALGEPVEVPSSTRERMYALGPAASKVSVAAAAPNTLPRYASTDELPSEALNDVLSQAEALTRPRSQASGNGRAAVKESFEQSLPDYLKRKSPWKSIVSAGVVLAIGAAWGFLAFDKFRGGTAVAPTNVEATTPAAPSVAEREPVEMDEAPEQAPADSPAPPQRTRSTPLSQPAGSAVVAATIPAPAAPTEEAPQSANSDDESAAPRDLPDPADNSDDEAPPSFRRKQAPAVGAPKEVASAARGNAPPVGAPEAPVPAPAPPAKYASPDGITLHYVNREQGWFALPRRALVHSGDELAVPEPFDCALEFDEGRGLLSVAGGSAFRWLGARPETPTSIELHRGRIVLKGTTLASESPTPVRTAVVLFGETWQVEIPSGGIVGIDALPVEPTGFEQEPTGDRYSGGIYVTSGEATIVDPIGRSIEIKSAGWLKLPVSAPAETDSDVPSLQAAPLQTLPKWMGPQTQSVSRSQSARLFEKRFKLDETVDLSLPAIAADPNPILSKMATETLGLIDAYGPLINVLQRTIHDEARRAAISALRMWLPRDPSHRGLLKTELAQVYPPDEVDAVYRLLWGFNQEDARDKANSLQFLEWMGHSEPSIRELAFTHVYRLTGKTHDYRAGNKPPELQRALRSWQQHIHREGALLAPLKENTGK